MTLTVNVIHIYEISILILGMGKYVCLSVCLYVIKGKTERRIIGEDLSYSTPPRFF